MTVDIIEKYRLPLFAPETEVGTASPEAPPLPQGDAGGVPEKPLSIRQSLEKGFDDARKTQEPKEPIKKGKSRDDKGKFAGEETKRAADAMREATEPVEGATATPAEGEVPEGTTEAKPEVPAPAAWAREAKEAWAALPPAVQQAVIKREADTQKGVDELKGKYAEIDAAMAPHLATIRQYGHTPAQAISQLWAWFQALHANPDAAFPALAKSFNWQPRPAAQPAAPAAGAPAQAAPAVGPDGKPVAQPAGEVPPQVQAYINSMEQKLNQFGQIVSQKFGTMEQQFAAQQEAKTNEILMNWAKDKPHFEALRGTMAQLISSGTVPLKEGRVDLDGAYDKAARLNDEIWQQQQQAAQKKLADDAKAAAAAKKAADESAAAAAKKAASSLVPGAPGSGAPAAAKGKKGHTVRESLLAAIDESRAT